MIASKITSKGQTTVPVAVRKALHLKPGESLGYQIDGDRVVLTRIGGAEDDPFATFTEWASEADQDAYASL